MFFTAHEVYVCAYTYVHIIVQSVLQSMV